MNRNNQSLAALFLFLMVTSLACSTINRWTDRASGARQTAQAAIQEAQEFATQSSGLVRTAQSFATQNPELFGTAEAFITEKGPALAATAEAFATQNPGLLETAQAYLTQSQSERPPEGIPLPRSYDLIYQRPDSVSFRSDQTPATLAGFYKTEMPALGWTYTSQGSLETENTAVLNYTRDNSQAVITMSYISVEQKTVVVIYVMR